MFIMIYLACFVAMTSSTLIRKRVSSVSRIVGTLLQNQRLQSSFSGGEGERERSGPALQAAVSQNVPTTNAVTIFRAESNPLFCF